MGFLLFSISRTFGGHAQPPPHCRLWNPGCRTGGARLGAASSPHPDPAISESNEWHFLVDVTVAVFVSRPASSPIFGEPFRVTARQEISV